MEADEYWMCHMVNQDYKFKFLELPRNETKELLIPQFQDILYEQHPDIEIYAIQGFQIMTSLGLYLLLSNDELQPIIG